MSLCGYGHLFGRVFKIHNIFLHYFIGFLTSINYMDKWVTPLGRMFKIRKKVVHDFVELSTLKRGLIKWVTPLGVR